MKLHSVQKNFRDLMLDHPDVLNTPSPEMSALFDEGLITLPARLKVYRNNIVGSLTDLMLASFPVMQELVGKAFLEQTARSFILSNPPEQGCLTWFGRGFDVFLENFSPAKSLPYLPDIARLEIALNEAYYAADDLALTPQDLSAIEPENLAATQFPLRDSVNLIKSSFPILDIHAFCLKNDPSETLDISGEGTNIMVYRPELETQIIALKADEFQMLAALQSGLNLGDALEQTRETYPDFDIQIFLQKNLADETFLKF
jgi:hypothetical protein